MILIAEQNVNFAMTLAQHLHLIEPSEIRMNGTFDELNSNVDINRAYFGH